MLYRMGPLVALLALSALYLPGLLAGKTLPARDVAATQIPWRTVWASQVKAGHLPLWDPASSGGRPLLANPNTMAAYPGTAIFLLCSPETGAAVHIALHHALLLLGCYALARRSGASQGAATVAAAAVATSGPAFSCVTLINTQAALAVAVWALVTAAKPPTDSRSAHRQALAGGALLGLCFLAGEPVVATMAMTAWLVVALLVWRPLRLFALAEVAVVASLIAAPVLLPLLSVYDETIRGVMGVAPGSLSADVLAPRRWPELLFPHILGAPLGDDATGFWAARSFPWQRYLPLVFFGSLPLVTLPFASRRRNMGPWWLLAGAGFLGAAVLGWPSAAHLAERLPVVGGARYGIKLLFFTLLALPPLLASGVDRLRARWVGSRRRVAAVATVMPLVLAATALAPEHTIRPLLGKLYPVSVPALTAVAANELRRGLLLDCLALALPPATALATAVAPVPVALAVFAANVLGGSQMLAFDSSETWRRPPPLAEALQRPAVVAPLAPTARPGDVPGPEVLRRYLASRAALAPNYGTRWGVAYTLTRGPDGLEPLLHELLAARTHQLALLAQTRVAAALGATAAVLPEPVPGLPALPVAGVWLASLESAGGSWYLPRRVIPADGIVATTQVLASESFRPDVDVVIDGRGGASELPGGRVRGTSGPPHRRHVTVDAGGRTLLVLRQSFMSCWRARVDHRPTDLVVVNGAQIGVWVPQGRHEVELYVQARPAILGLLGPLVVLLAAVVREAAWRARRVPRYGGVRSTRATPPGR